MSLIPTQIKNMKNARSVMAAAPLAMATSIALMATPAAFAQTNSDPAQMRVNSSANSAAARTGATAANPQTTDGTQVEAILGYAPDANGISFQVNSGGCTQPDDFRVQGERNGANSMKLTLLRTKPDTCHSFVPTGQRIYMTYSQMGMDPQMLFVLANPNGTVNPPVWGQN